jgi:hypothetical protein
MAMNQVMLGNRALGGGTQNAGAQGCVAIAAKAMAVFALRRPASEAQRTPGV